MRSRVVLALASAIAVAQLGCAADTPGVFIEGVLIGDTMCQFTGSSARLTNGVLDLDERLTYVAPVAISNQIYNRGNRSTGSADPGNVFITDTDITIVGLDRQPLVPTFRMPQTTVFIPSARDVNTRSTAVGQFVLIPPGVGAQLQPLVSPTGPVDVVVKVRALGHTGGGSSVRVIEFEFAVTLCSGCLRVPCTAVPDSSTQRPCATGQDGFVYCDPPAI